MEKFKYHGVVFTCNGRRNKEIDRFVKQKQFCVSFIALWWRNGSFRAPQSWQFSNRFLFRSSSTVCSWLKESCLKCKRQRWHFCEECSRCDTSRKVSNCEIRKALSVEPLLRMERSQLRWFGHVSRMSQEISASQSYWLPYEKTAQRSHKDQVEWLRLRLAVVSCWCGVSIYPRLLKTVRYFGSSWDSCTRELPQRKSWCANQWTIFGWTLDISTTLNLVTP